jgi:transcriptional regulator with XRE-family HTH domain
MKGRGTTANFGIIRELCNVKKITLKDLCGKINISQNGLQQILGKNSTKTEILEAIAKELEVPIGIFFDDNFYKEFKLKEEKYSRCLDENYILSDLVSEMRFRLSLGQLQNENLRNNIKHFVAKYSDDEYSKFLSTINESSNFNPFNIDILKYTDDYKVELEGMKEKEEETKNMFTSLAELRDTYLAEGIAKTDEFFKRHPQFKEFEDKIKDFIINEIITIPDPPLDIENNIKSLKKPNKRNI